jgi:hypothetical protein
MSDNVVDMIKPTHLICNKGFSPVGLIITGKPDSCANSSAISITCGDTIVSIVKATTLKQSIEASGPPI